MAGRCIYRTASNLSSWRKLLLPQGPLPVASLQVGRMLATEPQRRYKYPTNEEEGVLEVKDADDTLSVDDRTEELIPDLPGEDLTTKLRLERSVAAARQAELELQSKKTETELSYLGISMVPFSEDIRKLLLMPLNTDDVEMKPDGLIYLPEIKFRRTLQTAFGPGGWALMPRGEPTHYQSDTESAQLVTREYALFCLGRFVSQSVGEHSFYTKANLSMGKALESAKSNALMRCCKDLGIASELWDPQYVADWKYRNAVEVWCENVRTKDKKKLWKKKKSREQFPYPWKEVKA